MTMTHYRPTGSVKNTHNHNHQALCSYHQWRFHFREDKVTGSLKETPVG